MGLLNDLTKGVLNLVKGMTKVIFWGGKQALKGINFSKKYSNSMNTQRKTFNRMGSRMKTREIEYKEEVL